MYKISTADRSRIVRLYTIERYTLREIAVEYPFSSRVVRRVLREEGVQLRKATTLPENRRKTRKDIWEQADAIVELYVVKKRSPRQIAAQFGCSIQPIVDILKAKGVTMRTLKESRRYRQDKYGYAEHQQVVVERKCWQPEVTVNRKMTVQELRDSQLTINEIADIKGMDRIDVFKELQG